MKIELDQISGKLKLQFYYKKELVDAIKSLPDRMYNPEDKTWSIQVSDEKALNELLAILAGNNWPQATLNAIEVEYKSYLALHPPQMTESGFQTKIKPPLQLMGALVIEAYLANRITDIEQKQILDILNHLSLKDFIHK